MQTMFLYKYMTKHDAYIPQCELHHCEERSCSAVVRLRCVGVRLHMSILMYAYAV